MQIDLFCIGKQDRQFLSLVEFYKQRIQYHAKLNIYELEVKNIKDEVKRNQIENQKMIELIKKRQKLKQMNLWACDPKGQSFTSEQMAFELSKRKDAGQALGFLIGGSKGLSPSTLEMCSQKLSFSKMTFPHQLFLRHAFGASLSQFSHNWGIPYHKI